MEGAGDEFAGVPLLLPPLIAGIFEAREEGVADLFSSTFRFFAGGALSFFMVVAVPFFVFAGAGLFLLGIVASGTVSVVGTGTDDSRRGDCLRPCSFFNALTALTEASMSVVRRASTGDDGCGVDADSCFIKAGVEILSSRLDNCCFS